MTNREWINSLSNKELIYLFSSVCSVCAYAGKVIDEYEMQMMQTIG